jgi:transposase
VVTSSIRGGHPVSQNFLSCDRDQELLLPPSLREWLPEDHLAWFVLDAVDQMDLTGFYGEYRDDGWGRAAHDPAMMVALLLYAYAVGERSSRRIERRCCEDIAFRVICANRVPDHATIARFRARHSQALAAIFTDILVLCAKAGLVSVGLVAVDGSLIAGNASLAATKTYRAIRQEVEQMLEQAARADADDDQRFGQARGDELPPELSDRNSRRQRLARCKAELEAEQAQQQAEYEANLDRRAEWELEHARKLGGRKPGAPAADALAKRTINTTDPESRALRRAGRRTVQGYNAQVVASPRQIILAAEITQAANDSAQLEPMIHHALGALAAAGIDEQLEVVLADGGYWNSPQITRLRQHGLTPIVPTKSRTRTAPRRLSARQGPEARRIERILDTPEGQALYRRRQQIVEPVFAHTKILRGIDRFQRRGLAACAAEWKLIAATHNLLKLWRLAPTAIAA